MTMLAAAVISPRSRRIASMFPLSAPSVFPPCGRTCVSSSSGLPRRVRSFGHATRCLKLRPCDYHATLSLNSGGKQNEQSQFSRASSLRRNAGEIQLPVRQTTAACEARNLAPRTVLGGERAARFVRKHFFCSVRSFSAFGTHAASETMTQPIMHRREQPARVRVRGLPFKAGPKDVANFFAGYQLAGSPEEAVQLQQGLNGRPSGYAFVYFVTEAEARRARDEKNRCYLGDRFIEIFVDADTGEMEWLYQKELSENINRKQHGKDNR